MSTHSETVFKRICEAQGYIVETLQPRAAQKIRTADFRITQDNVSIIAEVEELRPNRDDLRQIREMKEKGETSGGTTIGARARKHIRDAADQLKAHQDENLPMIIVLYDNVRTEDGRVGYPMFHLRTSDIDAAMYGDLVVHVSLTSKKSTKPDRNGGGRTLTADRKTYVSAIAVISDHDDSTVIFYHYCPVKN